MVTPKLALPVGAIIEATVYDGRWHNLDLTAELARTLQATSRRQETRRSLGHIASGIAAGIAGVAAAKLLAAGDTEETLAAAAGTLGGLWAIGGAVYGGVKTYLRWERRTVIRGLSFLRLDTAGPQLPPRTMH